ncbi:conserved Plasmodium protein, unknown function [Plasmodium sp. DRC-Itaito]|uniref:ATP synthase-associated protein n=1 Tax=Plasmodium gaboni TaxID=647221 RepID=A0ABY1UHM3_9APIC|nr:conserved Plasmodium protein, unknown function [Plasmodium gaboni]SOV20516.1 conserved Plasmodium protein, unknown function [Plasmodium sp. DRC-Itaito]
MYRRYVWNSIFRDINYRLKKIYHSFYYAQSHIKYVMLILFPAIIWTTRYRADTQLGYFFYINDEKLYPTYRHNIIKKKMKWKNGSKFYLNDNVTVKDAKNIIYEGEKNVPDKIKLGCKGRIMDDNDNLAMAVRAFCKRDPKIFIWQDEHSQYL